MAKTKTYQNLLKNLIQSVEIDLEVSGRDILIGTLLEFKLKDIPFLVYSFHQNGETLKDVAKKYRTEIDPELTYHRAWTLKKRWDKEIEVLKLMNKKHA